MAENSMFFDGPAYPASEFVRYFAQFLDDGVYTSNNQMGLGITISGLRITIDPGNAFIKGYMYESDTAIVFDLEAADGILDRIDRIVLRLDIEGQHMGLRVKKGDLGSNPAPPALIEEANIKEILLYQIRVNKGSNTGIVTDERIPVSSLMEVPYLDIKAEFDKWFTSVQNELGRRIKVGQYEPADIQVGDIWHKEY
ncbi:MAG TPA: hypothetical protein VFD33_02845 [Bacillota bacterium]|nr:hypothetical protein [Bacillota bacterium]